MEEVVESREELFLSSASGQELQSLMFRATDYPSTGLSGNKSVGRSCALFQLKDLTSLRATRGPELLAKGADFLLS